MRKVIFDSADAFFVKSKISVYSPRGITKTLSSLYTVLFGISPHKIFAKILFYHIHITFAVQMG